MRYVLPFALLASPAVAHPAAIVHSHSADAVVFGLALIAIAGVGAFVRAKAKARDK